MRVSQNQPVIAAILLFLSGMAGLILQVCWFREFRFIFGLTTGASAEFEEFDRNAASSAPR